MVTLSILLVRSGLIPGLYAALVLILIVCLSLRLHQPFGISHSTRALLAHARKSAAGSSRGVHSFDVRLNQNLNVWILCLALISFCLGFALVIIFHSFAIEVALLAVSLGYAIWKQNNGLQILATASLWFILVMNPANTAVIGIAVSVLITTLTLAWYRRHWLVLSPSIIGSFLVAYAAFPKIGAYLLVGTVMYGVSAAVVTIKRLPAEREAVRTVLVLTYFPALLLLVQYAPAYAPLPIVLSLLCAALAWSQHGRNSYAKYFLLIALYLLLVVVAVSFNSGWLVLTGIVVATGLVAVGNYCESYTFRLAGLATLAGSFAVYTVEILPVLPNFRIDPVLNRIGIGLLFAICLPILADWYASLKLETFERKVISHLRDAMIGISALLLFLLIMLQTRSWLQSLLLIALSAAALGFASRHRAPLLRTAALATMVAAVPKLILVDAVSFALGRTEFILLTLFLIAVAVIIIYRQTHNQNRFRASSATTTKV